MYSRILKPQKDSSFFLFGARGTGKTSWLRQNFSDSNFLDLLDDTIYTELLSDPTRLSRFVKDEKAPIILDEVQKIPALLDEVHRLIEKKRWKFILTGSNARKLKRGGGNLLAGRAITHFMYPLTAKELGSKFELARVLRYGTLPMSISSPNPSQYLKSYIATYLKEEILAEGLTRNLSAFARFLEVASFSHGQILNVSGVAQDAHINQKLAESYFEILEDLLLAYKVPVFARRAKRKMTVRPKFYFFDAGVFCSLRPRGPLDSEADLLGPALEGLVLQDFIAMNSNLDWNYQVSFWRPTTHVEVDFVFYGPRGFFAIEVKSGSRLRREDFEGLEAFHEDYPTATRILLYAGERRDHQNGIEVLPIKDWFNEYPKKLSKI